MDFLLEALTNWLKEMLVGGIMSNLSGMFDSVNQQVADISVQVGQTPQGWNGSIFNMIENLSNSIMVPIAGVILAIVMTVDLIQMIADKNNLHAIHAQQPEIEEETPKPTLREQFEQYKPVVTAAISEDVAYRNACGHSDRENAVIEGNAAVRRAVLGSKDIPNDNPETVRCGYALSSHPAVLDGFIDLVREKQQRSRTQEEKLQPSRPSVRDKLKQELPAHKPAAPKKWEPER